MRKNKFIVNNFRMIKAILIVIFDNEMSTRRNIIFQSDNSESLRSLFNDLMVEEEVDFAAGFQ